MKAFRNVETAIPRCVHKPFFYLSLRRCFVTRMSIAFKSPVTLSNPVARATMSSLCIFRLPFVYLLE